MELIPAIILFVVTYALMLIFPKYRPYIATGSGIIFIASGMLPATNIISSIDFNVILMIVGTMGLVSLFTESKMPSLLADLLMEKVPNVQWAAVALALFAGIISAFVDNVATVLMIAPIALEICKKLSVNPVPFIIAIAVSSNLQGAATLVGDTTAIMLGSELNMSFLDFFVYDRKLGIFFAVELGAVISAFILAFVFRKEKAPIPKGAVRTKVTDFFPTALLLAMLILLIAVSFISEKPAETNGLICCALLVIGLVYSFIRKKKLSAFTEPLQQIDFETIGILFGLFLMIGGLDASGVISKAGELLASLGGSNMFLLYTVIVWASVVVSAFIDNIPYVATMIPIISGMAPALGVDPAALTPLYFGLLSGATLGGNCTPIGASANITGIGILRRAGYEVGNSDFFKIGIPFTIAAIIPAYIFIWLVFGV